MSLGWPHFGAVGAVDDAIVVLVELAREAAEGRDEDVRPVRPRQS